MLIVLERAPVAAPGESVLSEETEAEVAVGDFVGVGSVAVYVRVSCLRLNLRFPVARLDTGIIERIDVHGESHAVGGEFLRACHGAVAETGGVVGGHRRLVLSAIVVDEHHALDGVAGVVELAEDGHEIVGDAAVTDEFAELDMAVERAVKQAQVAQVGTRDAAVGGERFAVNALEGGVVYLVDGETLVQSERLHGLFGNPCARLPLGECLCCGCFLGGWKQMLRAPCFCLQGSGSEEERQEERGESFHCCFSLSFIFLSSLSVVVAVVV